MQQTHLTIDAKRSSVPCEGRCGQNMFKLLSGGEISEPMTFKYKESRNKMYNASP